MGIKVFTAFSGYDSQCLALNRIGIDYNLVGWSEIDRYAIQAHNALFPAAKNLNYGDISKIDWKTVPDFDLFTYSSPCQDFSQAGLQRGGEKRFCSQILAAKTTFHVKQKKYNIMRQIKFRAKTKKNEWVYGYYVYTYPNEHRIFGKDRTSIEVTGETVGQFTGLKDKNGNEIYEGDIIKEVNNYTIPSMETKYVVELKKGAFCSGGENLIYACQFRHAEVIGNKFDNPELIKKKK